MAGLRGAGLRIWAIKSSAMGAASQLHEKPWQPRHITGRRQPPARQPGPSGQTTQFGPHLLPARMESCGSFMAQCARGTLPRGEDDRVGEG
ncbi:hypothetical protein E2C01_022772 [Portunus trituberculatus]|uniref:Uncharacterized protein n=1 Tax=Portunus trituberculatus TaxID=210409 RepID=A0A5B7E972_PORTR|nr:hypothetical protein [Portunus trituberculatus]